jgi:hypothetical protein
MKLATSTIAQNQKIVLDHSKNNSGDVILKIIIKMTFGILNLVNRSKIQNYEMTLIVF